MREEGCWGRNRLKFLIRNTGDKSLKGRWAQVGICIWGNAPFAATMFPSFICCKLLFELEGSTMSLTVAESSETTTGSVAEVDAD